MELTRFGVWTSLRAIGEDNGAAGAKVAEQLGYGTLWLGGSSRLPNLVPMLEATTNLIVATSIVNVWQYEPAELAAEYHQLEARFPGRVLVGIGIGHPETTSEYQQPLAKMRAFLDGIADAPQPIPHDRMIIAALGPKMLELAGERTLGTIPYFVSAEHTSFARSRMHPPKLVAPELAVVVDEDETRAAATARAYAKMYLGLRNYTSNLLRFGFEPSDIENGGSDRLIDTVVPQGSADSLARHVEVHFDAGADHVCVQTVGVQGVPEQAWAAVAKAVGLGA